MISGPQKRYAHALYRLVTGLKMVFRIFAGEEAYSTCQCDEREECVFDTYQLLRDQGLVEKENRYQTEYAARSIDCQWAKARQMYALHL